MLQRRGWRLRDVRRRDERFNGAAELLQRRAARGPLARVPLGRASTEPLNCFSGEHDLDATLLEIAVASTEPLNCFSGEGAAPGVWRADRRIASTEPLNCFSGERVVNEIVDLEFRASTEPLNCFSGERFDMATKSLTPWGFNGAAELLQWRGA